MSKIAHFDIMENHNVKNYVFLHLFRVILTFFVNIKILKS
nr:MAG TPA: hypothetical protein [Bacteriophage sp.]